MRVFKSILRAEILWSEILVFTRSLLESDLYVWLFFPSLSINTVVERENIRRKLEYFGIATARREHFPILSSRFPQQKSELLLMLLSKPNSLKVHCQFAGQRNATYWTF